MLSRQLKPNYMSTFKVKSESVRQFIENYIPSKVMSNECRSYSSLFCRLIVIPKNKEIKNFDTVEIEIDSLALDGKTVILNTWVYNAQPYDNINIQLELSGFTAKVIDSEEDKNLF